jgi:hypothetical protein
MTLARLKSHIQSFTQDYQDRPPSIGRPHSMPKAVNAMRKKFNGGGELRNARDRILEAISAFYDGDTDDVILKYGRHLCWGLVTETTDYAPLLAQDDFFPDLLGSLNSGFGNNRLRLVAWRGLLEGYLTASESIRAESHKNWELLRRFLNETYTQVIGKAKFKPDWVLVLEQNQELLSDQPCKKYADSALKGNDDKLDPLRKELHIPDESWFWHELLLEQVRTAVSYSDDNFSQILDTILITLEKFPLFATEALKLLLTRYEESFSSQPHQGLQDFAVDKWGSPALSSQAQWGLVEPPVKQMVMEWLVLEDLKDFFEVLQEDGEADERRFKYWLRFLKQINYAKIGLGRAAMFSRKQDLVELKRRKKERIFSLIQSGLHNNAFVLKIGDYFFVEFSQTGNATYGYSKESIPFDLNSSEISLYKLKESGHVLREIHRDSNQWRTWEYKFDKALAQLGIYPDSQSANHTNQANRPHTTQTNNRYSNTRNSQSRQSVELHEDEFNEFCMEFSLTFIDNREKGGALWIKYYRTDNNIARTLIKMGFKYAVGKGYWRN